MKLGAENRKKAIFAAVLAAVAVVLLVRMIVSGNGTAPASGSSTAAIQPSATPVAHKAAVKSRISNDLDPSLKTDLLRGIEEIGYDGGGRNPFQAASDPLPPPPPPVCAQPGGPSRGLPWCVPITVPEPAPPPPIDLKFYGFASRPGEPKKAFLSQKRGQDIFIAKEGDIVDRRYKVVEIKPSSVMIEDVLNNHTQEIPLTTQTTS